MTTAKIIKEFERLSLQERAKVVAYIQNLEDDKNPESFEQGMADIAAGRVVDMEEAFDKVPPSHCTKARIEKLKR